jgi:DNA-binding transcriptional LysR family regulator
VAGWQLFRGEEQAGVAGMPRLLINNNIAARDAAAAGLGIAYLPRFQAAPLSRRAPLTRVLPGWSGAPVPVHAVFASSRYLAPKVRAFVDVARGKFREAFEA